MKETAVEQGAADVLEDAADGKEAEKKIKIFINEDKYEVPNAAMTGAEMKALAGIVSENQLFMDAPGHHDDPQVFDDVPFDLKSGMKFYDVPVGNLGAR
jgi:hypothetical protein